MQALQRVPLNGQSLAAPLTATVHSASGHTLWRASGVRCVLVPFGAGTAVELPALLAASRLLLRRVLPAVTRLAAATTA